jgi:citrate lyase beta subunit
MQLSIPEHEKTRLLTTLKSANLRFQQVYPGDKPDRQPVHTVYGGANLFKADTCRRMGEIALQHLQTYAPNAAALEQALQIKGIATIYQKIIKKLKTEPVEDFRIDFEDGFGNRPDVEEDATAIAAAKELAIGMQQHSLSPFIGIRIKPFTEDLKERSVRTLDLFLTTLLGQTKGALPDNFVVMLPKVTIPEQVTTLVRLFELFEKTHRLPAGTLQMETMVEATQIIMDDEGKNPLMRIIRASEGRCIAAHFGTYDYTASCGITAKYQTMAHPVCDFAHHMTKVALGGTGIFLSDGATNVIPVPLHKGDHLSFEQQSENREHIFHAWRTCFNHTTHSLINGFYQGWDLNPAQLPMRYAATFHFFLSNYEDALYRLKSFVERSAVSTLTGDIFDDAATGQGLLNFFIKAINCGALSEEEVLGTGLTMPEIRSRSFYRILEGRREQHTPAFRRG